MCVAFSGDQEIWWLFGVGQTFRIFIVMWCRKTAHEHVPTYLCIMYIHTNTKIFVNYGWVWVQKGIDRVKENPLCII